MTPIDKANRIDLGLAVLSALHPGKRFTYEEIAAWCDCPKATINRIDHETLANLRRGLKQGLAVPEKQL